MGISLVITYAASMLLAFLPNGLSLAINQYCETCSSKPIFLQERQPMSALIEEAMTRDINNLLQPIESDAAAKTLSPKATVVHELESSQQSTLSRVISDMLSAYEENKRNSIQQRNAKQTPPLVQGELEHVVSNYAGNSDKKRIQKKRETTVEIASTTQESQETELNARNHSLETTVQSTTKESCGEQFENITIILSESIDLDTKKNKEIVDEIAVLDDGILENIKVHNNDALKCDDSSGARSVESKECFENFASSRCGAKIMDCTMNSKNCRAVLSSSIEEYMLSPCEHQVWFELELCEPIKPQKISLGNRELFSSMPRKFSVAITKSILRRWKNWIVIGYYEAEAKRVVQTFDVNTDLFVRYVRVEIHSHYLKEYYCPLTMFAMCGMTQLESYKLTEFDDIDDYEYYWEDSEEVVSDEESGSESSNQQKPKKQQLRKRKRYRGETILSRVDHRIRELQLNVSLGKKYLDILPNHMIRHFEKVDFTLSELEYKKDMLLKSHRKSDNRTDKLDEIYKNIENVYFEFRYKLHAYVAIYSVIVLSLILYWYGATRRHNENLRQINEKHKLASGYRHDLTNQDKPNESGEVAMHILLDVIDTVATEAKHPQLSIYEIYDEIIREEKINSINLPTNVLENKDETNSSTSTENMVSATSTLEQDFVFGNEMPEQQKISVKYYEMKKQSEDF